MKVQRDFSLSPVEDFDSIVDNRDSVSTVCADTAVNVEPVVVSSGRRKTKETVVGRGRNTTVLTSLSSGSRTRSQSRSSETTSLMPPPSVASTRKRTAGLKTQSRSSSREPSPVQSAGEAKSRARRRSVRGNGGRLAG